MRPYLIYCPNFDHASGGIRSLHILCRDLRMIGYDARITSFLPGFTPDKAFIAGAQEIAEYANSGAIAVYPEGVIENPFKCQKVARLLLAPTQIKHAKEEIKFVYTKALWNQCGTLPVLYIPMIEPDVFYSGNEERIYKCDYKGKSKILRAPVGTDHVLITRWPNWPATRMELADLLRRSKILYCYDNLSILPHEAALCGCPTVIIPDGTRTRAEVAGNELGMDGIAWGEEELPTAAWTLYKAKLNYDFIIAKYMNEYLPRFIELTQK